MKLTGKCKEDFEKWYKENNYRNAKRDKTLNFICLSFWSKQDNQKYGVLVDFFDSVVIKIQIEPFDSFIFDVIIIFEENDDVYVLDKGFKTRPKARTAAIKKANEIYNELNNKI